MARNILWFVMVAATALLQTTWPDALRLQGVLPDLILALVVYFAMVDGEERAMWTGVVGGIFEDVASDTILGHHVFCLVLIGYLAGRLSTRLVTEHPAVKVGLVLCAGLAHGILYMGIAYVQDPDTRFVNTVITSAVPGAFYTALITPVVYALFGWLFQRRQPIPGGIF